MKSSKSNMDFKSLIQRFQGWIAPKQVRSIKGHLTFWLLAFLIPLRLITGFLSYGQMESSAIKAFDLGIEDNLRGLIALTEEKDGKIIFKPHPGLTTFLETNAVDEIFFQITGPHGEVLGGNATLPSPVDLNKNLKFVDAKINNKDVRLGILRQPLTHTIGKNEYVYVQVAQTLHGRTLTLYSSLLYSFGVSIVSIFLIVVIVGRCTRQSLASLEKAQRDLRNRSPMDLTPLDTSDMTAELQPFLTAVNQLLERLSSDIGIQKRFLENAAHELKTPLAGIKSLSEVILREKDSKSRAILLEQMISCVDRTANLSRKLLSLSNAGTLKGRTKEFTTCDIVSISQEVIMSYIPEAASKHIDLGYEGTDTPVFITGDVGSLHELIANLLENAIRYTSPYGQVTLSVKKNPTPEICVLDNGPGIPFEAKEKVFERFFRVLGTQVDGSGLGLSIVKEIVDGHGATIAIETGPHGKGNLMRVTFPTSIVANNETTVKSEDISFIETHKSIPLILEQA